MSRLRVELWADDTLVADSESPDLWAKVFTVVASQSGTGGSDRAELPASTGQPEQPNAPSSPVDGHVDRERHRQRPALVLTRKG